MQLIYKLIISTLVFYGELHVQMLKMAISGNDKELLNNILHPDCHSELNHCWTILKISQKSVNNVFE